MTDKVDMDIADSKAVPNILNPPSKVIGNALSDLLNIAFGYLLHEKSEEKRLKSQKHIEELSKKLNENVSSIPEEHRIPPKKSIVGPALEATKYYFEEDEIREMFENLITNSMDNRQSAKVHPSFTEIIKQMSPLDAQNLKLFEHKAQLPIVQFKAKSRDDINKYIQVATNVFISNTDCQDIDLQAVSISSLCRIGLLEIRYGEYLTDNSIYEPFLSLPIYNDTKNQLDLLNIASDKFPEITNKEKYYLHYEKGVVQLTPLGNTFISVCLNPLPNKKPNP